MSDRAASGAVDLGLQRGEVARAAGEAATDANDSDGAVVPPVESDEDVLELFGDSADDEDPAVVARRRA